ncbi:MAG TPA: DUF1295 domain-containing protein [Roseiarcus sp.]|nr:DUF1295 domain-containing protein [Roseiarcus sp.]
MPLASTSLALLIATIALSTAMAAAWVAQRATGRTGWIDAIWTFGVGATAASLAAAPLGEEDGAGWRRGAVAVAVALWAVRLGSHIIARTRKAPDDPRYRKLIETWGSAAPPRLFAFLQSQALVGVVLAFAVTLAAHAPSPTLRAQDIGGLALFSIALVGEAAADAELARFQANPANRGRICDIKLWSRSRHPNYFFEWLVWIAFALTATGDAVGLSAWLAPALMYGILRYASGVPPLEDHMLLTRGDEFRAYRRRTPVFFPRIF